MAMGTCVTVDSLITSDQYFTINIVRYAFIEKLFNSSFSRRESSQKIPELTEITCFIRLCFVWHGSFKVLFHPSTTAAEHPINPRYRLFVLQNFFRLIFSHLLPQNGVIRSETPGIAPSSLHFSLLFSLILFIILILVSVFLWLHGAGCMDG